ncbi:hypothetical protein [Kitasatospora paranensis]|uniref:Uncharacterized protein n=1 Tax=Kitasatospora paranensis TaxID=258053 RepID=A0ABW2FRC0_9ACTN
MNTATTMTEAGTDRTTDDQAAAAAGGLAPEPLPTVAELRIPSWFFAFEAVLAGAFDVLRVFPSAWPGLVVLGLANAALSFTVLRSRLRLAKLMWRGKGTRKVALALLGLRVGVHLLLSAVGLAASSPLVHLALALVMSGLTITLLVFAQRTSLRALVADGRIAA